MLCVILDEDLDSRGKSEVGIVQEHVERKMLISDNVTMLPTKGCLIQFPIT